MWDPLTGERKPVNKEVLANIEKGGVVVEGSSGVEVLGEYDQSREVVVKRELDDIKHGDMGDADADEDIMDVDADGEEGEEEWMFTPSSWHLRSSEDGD